MFKTILCAVAIAALTLTSTVVIAKNGGNGNNGAPATRQKTTSDKPDFAFKKMRILRCGKYGRSDGEGGVTMVTVCN